MKPIRQERLTGRRSLRDFAAAALDMLSTQPGVDEVVLLVKDVVEIESDCQTPPGSIHPLPDGYVYRFSGWWGMYLGVCRSQAAARAGGT